MKTGNEGSESKETEYVVTKKQPEEEKWENNKKSPKKKKKIPPFALDLTIPFEKKYTKVNNTVVKLRATNVNFTRCRAYKYCSRKKNSTLSQLLQVKKKKKGKNVFLHRDGKCNAEFCCDNVGVQKKDKIKGTVVIIIKFYRRRHIVSWNHMCRGLAGGWGGGGLLHSLRHFYFEV